MLPSTYNASSMLRSDYGPLERIGAIDSTVYRGRGNDGAFVTLRFFHSEDPIVRDALSEVAHTASAIRHPMLAAVGGCQRFAGDALCIVSEYVPGQPLDRWILEHGQPTLRMTVDFVRRLSLGLHVVHSRELTHGSLHPGNLIVLQPDTRPGGRIVAKLLDVGVPSWLRVWPPRLAAAQFVAPELLNATRRPSAPEVSGDAISDVFACGALLYFMCTGIAPFQSGSLSQLKAAANTARPIPRPSYINPEIPPELEDVLMRALAIDPSDRIDSMAELALCLGDVESLWSDSGVRRRDSTPDARRRRLPSPDAVTPVVHPHGVRTQQASQSSPTKIEALLPRGVVRSHAPVRPAAPPSVTPRPQVAPSGTYPALEWPKPRRSRAGIALVAASTLVAGFAAYFASVSGDAHEGQLKHLPPTTLTLRAQAPEPRTTVRPSDTQPFDPQPTAAVATGARTVSRATMFTSEADARASARAERAHERAARRPRERDSDTVAAQNAAALATAKAAEQELLADAPLVDLAPPPQHPLATPPSFAESTPVEPVPAAPVAAKTPSVVDPEPTSTAAPKVASLGPRAVQISQVHVRGSLSPSVVRHAIDRIQPFLRRCVEEHAPLTRPAHSEVELSATIDEIGRARTPIARGSAARELNECLVTAAGKLVSDTPDTGTVKVSWTVEY